VMCLGATATPNAHTWASPCCNGPTRSAGSEARLGFARREGRRVTDDVSTRGTDMTEYAVTDPRTGERVSDVPTDTDEQVRGAVATAHQTFQTWGRTSTVAERAALIRKVADLHTERREALAAAMNREMGKAMDDALGEVDFSASIYGYYADNAEKFLADEPIELLDGDGTAVIRRRPLGVILGIMPWNYPAYQVARF